jgi:16S rRNA (uracil1498-N3)-methyltransferase
MSVAWFWVEGGVRSGALVLSVDESRHVASRRLRVGDEIVVFDGLGRRAQARIEGGGRKAIEVAVGEVEMLSPPGEAFGLATAIPKGDRLTTMLQMWTQLGLEVWQPLVLEESAVRRFDPESPRTRRILIEGCKVARRVWPLRILPPRSLDQALALHAPDAAVYYGDRAGRRAAPSTGGSGNRGWVFIGPEAGFSAGELEALGSAGAEALRFAEHNLRIETAAIAAMVAFTMGGTSPRDDGSRDES